MSYAALNVTRAIAAPAEKPIYPRLYNINRSAAIRILLVEDDASDIMLTKIALDAAGMDYNLCTLKNGEEVVPYLRRQLKNRDGHIPDVLLLDLSLPEVDGFEILSTLAEMSVISERISTLPIVILTGDTHCAFLKRCYGLNIMEYLTKPCSAEKIHNLMNALRRNKNR